MSGEGSVFRRASDGAWLAQISRGKRGERKTWSRSASTKSGALRKLIELRAELDKPKEEPAPAPVAETVESFLTRWVSDARNIRPTTRRGYDTVVRHHLVPTIGHIPLAALTPANVETMLSVLAPDVSEKYLRNIHATLRRALNQAVRLGLVSRNVAGREFVDAPKVTMRDPDALTDDQLAAILDADDSLAPLWRVLADCGLRMGEALGLWWQDVEPGVIHVRQELVRRDGKYERANPKTDRSIRDVPTTPEVDAALAKLRKEGGRTTWVFLGAKGKPLSGSYVTHRFYDLCAAVGLDRRPPKVLRATYASRLMRRGVASRTIADLMGHARERTTQRHYIATSPEQAREAVRRLVG